MEVLTWSIVFSVFGAAYFSYGKGQDKQVPFYCGILLMVFPYFVSNLYIMIPLGVLFLILPFIASRFLD